MFLTITSTAPSASDLGHLLHKHPDRVQTFAVPFGQAHVFYPEVEENRCTAALLVEIDPLELARSQRGKGLDGPLSEYVNDRPYAASSLFAVALGKVFGTAMKGRCAARPDLEGRRLPLVLRVPAVPTGGRADLVRRFFEPLGWTVATSTGPLDPAFTHWGDSRHARVTLTGEQTLADALGHLYVLLPALDGTKHYWVGEDEVDKLVRAGGRWLAEHPEREVIAHRYLARRRSYVRAATARLDELEGVVPPADQSGGDDGDTARSTPPTSLPTSLPTPPPTLPLAVERRRVVVDLLRESGARRVVDVGCGEGQLLRDLLALPTFTHLLGIDVSATELGRAERRLGLDRLGDHQRRRVSLRQSSVTYRDEGLRGFDAMVLMEVIEHVDPDRLPDLERCVFAEARPGLVLVTTPNVEFNVRYPALGAGRFRHPDHRFEWTRIEFEGWASKVAVAHGYAVQIRPVGESDPEVGPATQLAVFTKDRSTEAGVR